MIRIWADLSEDQNAKLKRLAAIRCLSRADLIRLAVRDYLVQNLPGDRAEQSRAVGQELHAFPEEG